MNLIWAVGGATAGLPLGTLLQRPVFRLSVPYGDPDRSACPHCAAPVNGWIISRCARCSSALGHPVVLAVTTAAVLALLLGRFGGQPDVVAFGFLGVIGVALAAIDIAVQRLPDRLTLPAIPVLIAALAGAALIGNDIGAFARALLGGLALTGTYLLLALVRPGQLGGGDIKLAGLAGLALGWLGWPTLVVGSALGFVLSALVGLALLALRRVSLQSHISFGPFLLGGALLAVLATSTLQGG